MTLLTKLTFKINGIFYHLLKLYCAHSVLSTLYTLSVFMSSLKLDTHNLSLTEKETGVAKN